MDLHSDLLSQNELSELTSEESPRSTVKVHFEKQTKAKVLQQNGDCPAK